MDIQEIKARIRAELNTLYYRLAVSDIDALIADHDAIAAERDRLREALRGALNYLQNTESELGIVMPCAARARAALGE